MSPQYDDLLRDLLSREADEITPAGDGLQRIQERVAARRDRLRWLRPVVALAVAAALVGVGAVVANVVQHKPTATTTPSHPSPTPPAPRPSTRNAPATFQLGGQPLWPYRTYAEAKASHHGGRPASTAIAFTTKYLGFTQIREVLHSTVNGNDAAITVGFSNGDGAARSTSAVIHLRRWGTATDAPWEVVGTNDAGSSFTVDTPSYGSSAHSPMAVGGTITGVDENIKLAVHQPSSPTAIGTGCCTPAGGQHSRWSGHVSFAGATDPVLTVVASTGGHVAAVERFTVTAVTNHPSSSRVVVSAAGGPAYLVGADGSSVEVYSGTTGQALHALTTVKGTVTVTQMSDDQQSVVYATSRPAAPGCDDGAVWRIGTTRGSTPHLLFRSHNITGVGVDATGRFVAITRLACPGPSATVLEEHDLATGTVHALTQPMAPPSFVGNPAVSSAGKVAITVQRSAANGSEVQLFTLGAGTTVNDGAPVPCPTSQGCKTSNPSFTDQGLSYLATTGTTTMLARGGGNAAQVLATLPAQDGFDGAHADFDTGGDAALIQVNAPSGRETLVWVQGHGFRTLPFIDSASW